MPAISKPKNLTDLVGSKIGKWEVLKFSHKDQYNNRMFLCRCKCGNEFAVRGTSLRTGRSTMCLPCMTKIANEIITTHGKTKTVEFEVWSSLAGRCTNTRHKQYDDYGGRGIKVCERWSGSDGFANFLSDMGPRPSDKHSIDRFPNNDGNYEPGNCRWATSKEQQRNLRSNRLITYKGKTQCVTAWSDDIGIPDGTIRKRIEAGWTPEQIIETPLRRQRNNKCLSE